MTGDQLRKPPFPARHQPETSFVARAATRTVGVLGHLDRLVNSSALQQHRELLDDVLILLGGETAAG